MSRIRQNTVLILNPAPGGAAYTTRKAALQFVRRGMAVFDSQGAIRFLDQARYLESHPCSDDTKGIFWWRRGKTGGMAQLIGSTRSPTAGNSGQN